MYVFFTPGSYVNRLKVRNHAAVQICCLCSGGVTLIVSGWPISAVHKQRDICACLIQLIKLSSSIWILESGVLDLHCKSILHEDDLCFSAQVYLSKRKMNEYPVSLWPRHPVTRSFQFISKCSLASATVNSVEYLTCYQAIYALYNENMLYVQQVYISCDYYFCQISSYQEFILRQIICFFVSFFFSPTNEWTN